LSTRLFFDSRIIFLWCEEPTHFGTGRAVGLVDLPIQRCVRTQLPIGQASSVRGVFRSYLTLIGEQNLAKQLFGPEPGERLLEAGNVTFSDAKLLLMPVRSLVGLSCWLTCPHSLEELRSAIARLGRLRTSPPPQLSDAERALNEVLGKPINRDEALVVEGTENVMDGRLVLLDGELDLTAKEDRQVGRLAAKLAELVGSEGYMRSSLEKRFAVVCDDLFKLSTLRGLEVATRIRTVYQRKTVERGGLWSEEYLPAASLFFCEMYAHSRTAESEGLRELVNNFVKLVNDKRLFVGGKESVGRGLVRIRILP